MTAILKTIPLKEKKAAFQIPSVDEIKAYMKTRMGWPDKFIDYYSEKMWCFYQSNGWKVSGKAAMKDWRAAFTSQWQRPKFKEDIEFLKECLKTKPVEKQNSSYLNDLLAAYKANFESVPQEALVAAYDYLKPKGLIKLSPDERERIIKAYSNDIPKGKAACVTTLFMNMINHGRTF